MKIFVVWLLVFNFFACGHNNQQQQQKIQAEVITKNVKEAKVMLLIFSGRENPEWHLSQKQIAGLTALFGTLPESEPSILQTGLGYQGFHIKLNGDTAENTYEAVVYKGRVKFTSADADKYFTDTDKRLELFLLDSADSLDSEIKESVRKEITTGNR